MSVSRSTVILQGPLAFRMKRLEAADEGVMGVQFSTIPLVAARLTGGLSALRAAKTSN